MSLGSLDVWATALYTKAEFPFGRKCRSKVILDDVISVVDVHTLSHRSL